MFCLERTVDYGNKQANKAADEQFALHAAYAHSGTHSAKCVDFWAATAAHRAAMCVKRGLPMPKKLSPLPPTPRKSLAVQDRPPSNPKKHPHAMIEYLKREVKRLETVASFEERRANMLEWVIEERNLGYPYGKVHLATAILENPHYFIPLLKHMPSTADSDLDRLREGIQEELATSFSSQEWILFKDLLLLYRDCLQRGGTYVRYDSEKECFVADVKPLFSDVPTDIWKMILRGHMNPNLHAREQELDTIQRELEGECRDLKRKIEKIENDNASYFEHSPSRKRFSYGGNNEHDALLEKKVFPIVKLSAEIGRLSGELECW